MLEKLSAKTKPLGAKKAKNIQSLLRPIKEQFNLNDANSLQTAESKLKDLIELEFRGADNLGAGYRNLVKSYKSYKTYNFLDLDEIKDIEDLKKLNELATLGVESRPSPSHNNKKLEEPVQNDDFDTWLEEQLKEKPDEEAEEEPDEEAEEENRKTQILKKIHAQIPKNSLDQLNSMAQSSANTKLIVNQMLATQFSLLDEDDDEETASPVPIQLELEDEDYEQIQQLAQDTAIATLQNNLRPLQPPPPPPRNSTQNAHTPHPAKSAIQTFEEGITHLEDEIKDIEDQNNDELDDDEREELLNKKQQLARKQSTVRQAQQSLNNAVTLYNASQTQTNPKDKLLLLNQAQQTLNQVVDTIDAANTPNNNKVNTLIIDEARRPGQTCLIQGVTDRAKLAGDFMQSHQLLPKSGTPSTFASSAKIVGGDTGVMFRGQALGAHDVVQYTESVNSGKEVIYSEIYQNKAGEPVATDRSRVTTPADKIKAAMIQAENILANYKGRGEIVITLDVKSGNDVKSAKEDLERLHMLYAAILHCSKKSTFDFSSYPPIRVVHPDFKAPQLTRLGVTSSSRANDYITTHLGVNPDGYLTHGDMSKQFKELRTHYKDILKTLTPGGGVDKKGQVIAGSAVEAKSSPLTQNALKQLPIKQKKPSTYNDDDLDSVVSDDSDESLDSVNIVDTVNSNRRLN